MSYAALMVYVEPDEAPEGRVRLAAGLADKFGAALIGLSARSIAPPILANGLMMPAAPDINALQRQLTDRGSWFGRIADSDRRKTEWRSALELANQMVTREARSADLVVIGQAKGWASKFDPLDPWRGDSEDGSSHPCRPQGGKLALPGACRHRLEGYPRGAPGGGDPLAAPAKGCAHNHLRSLWPG